MLHSNGTAWYFSWFCCLVTIPFSALEVNLTICTIQIHILLTCLFTYTHWIPGMWSRSRRLGLFSDKILNVSVSDWCVSSRSHSNMFRSQPSRSRLRSRAIASRRDVLCRRALCVL